MRTKTKQASGFLIIYFISGSYYSNRILTRFIFQSAGKNGWIFIWGIALVMLLASIPLYRFIQSIQGKDFKILYQKHPVIKKMVVSLMYLYLFISMFLCLTFLMTITNSSWLSQTPFTMILVPFLLIIYYVLYQKKDVLYRLATLFIYPIMLQYLIFVFSKNKSFDLFAIIPFSSQMPTRPFVALLAGLNMILDLGFCLFYFQECQQKIKKLPYALVIFIHLFSLCYDSLIATGQFGTLIAQIPYAYYESWRIINFGQYIVYLDVFAFFYWVTSAFCRLAISMSLIKTYDQPKKIIYHGTYIALWLSVVYVLSKASLYTSLRVPLLFTATLALMISLILHIYIIRKQVKQ